ncbi:hypothetical protein RHMOL_Rhmol07G0295500 [Rhododendron molle]|uniref:Uncharacterized protein n=1 Tax=Rhododendron molle TaxID=49168 RepID=A0ACC0N5W3_RHOML|nr:hypothetical protein RHMOL_Rhmol07G0295500 [Rhododendron molle]
MATERVGGGYHYSRLRFSNLNSFLFLPRFPPGFIFTLHPRPKRGTGIPAGNRGSKDSKTFIKKSHMPLENKNHETKFQKKKYNLDCCYN